MSAEAHLEFACFGGVASVHVRGSDEEQGHRLAERGRELLLDAHQRLSRFEPGSELSRLNRDPHPEVPASPLLRRLVAAVHTAGSRSGGLVDATLLDAIERAGYRSSLKPAEVRPLTRAELAAQDQAPARPSVTAEWCSVRVDAAAGTVVRPPGVRIDGGGIAKGLLADLVGDELAAAEAFAVGCCGDIRLGGSSALRRRIRVDDPFGTEPLHEFEVSAGAVATSGITRRSWGRSGVSAHQILDPASGRPAFTGIVQATALAPTALEAEILAKSALLSGPERAKDWLPFGGVLVPVEGEAEVIGGAASLAGAVAA